MADAVKPTDVLVILGTVANVVAFLLVTPASSYTRFSTESRGRFTVMKTSVATAVVQLLDRETETDKNIETGWMAE